jgi:hypothetical protein
MQFATTVTPHVGVPLDAAARTSRAPLLTP